jgi:DNA-directed RNA polymerase specialized sigma24 family protein
MRDPDEFDAFYKDARTRLLLQTYALTGDLPASRAAVRDSFVVAWHRWRKLSQQQDPEAWARPHAWAHAQRRHTARVWHRERGLTPEARATLDALGKLPVAQRKALLLTQLTSLSMSEMAREVGLPRAEAERALQTATARLAVNRAVPTTSIRALFEPLREYVETAQWPRATIVRRAGAARRRTHTIAGVLATVAALAVTGSLVTDGTGVRPTLAREDPLGAHVPGAPPPRHAPQPKEPVDLPAGAMLTARQVAARLHGVPARDWRATEPSDNTSGDGLVMPCQRERYADPSGTAGLVRTFRTTPGRTTPGRTTPGPSAVQAVEVSRSTRAARRTFDTATEWYAGCLDGRVQLLTTRRVDRVGDEGLVLVLRDWDRPVRTMAVAVARTGRLTTTTMTRLPGADGPAPGASASLLAAAVDGLCRLPAGGACALSPRLRAVPPPAVGEVPGMLSEVDLPPVAGVARAWVGTEPRRALSNAAATRCDRADFGSPPMTNDLTRSFVVPGARLPDQFGLTETVGSLPAARAKAFVNGVRSRMASCHDRELGTEVSALRQVQSGASELDVWRVRTELSDQSSVVFLMGIARHGTSVAQVGFVPDGNVGIGTGAFLALVDRALERLAALPPPQSRR